MGNSIYATDNTLVNITDVDFSNDLVGSKLGDKQSNITNVKEGGFMYVMSNKELLISSSQFNFSRSEIKGGALSIYKSETIQINNSLFYNNRVQNLKENTYGGQIFAEDTTEIRINQTKFIKGYSERFGGSLFIRDS